MTARQVWEGMLTELSKVNAPSLLLHEFNYYFNKAINLYINKRYNIYDVNLQTTDDLRVLKATEYLDVTKSSDGYNRAKVYAAGKAKLFDATYEVMLPQDYLHILNCVCIYELTRDDLCYDSGNYVHVPAKRLTSDAWSVILNDYYNRPLPWRPYYYIHNVNQQSDIPTGTEDKYIKYKVEPDSVESEVKYTWYKKGTNNNNIYYIVSGNNIYEAKGNDKDDIYEIKLDSSGKPTPATGVTISELTAQSITIPKTKVTPVVNSNFARTITLKNPSTGETREASTVIKEAAVRYGNTSKVRCEIRYGNDASVYKLVLVQVDYIKAPQTIRLTKEQVDLTQDTSQIMEFPDYVCQEIINELTMLIMARDADPRLQVLPSVTLSIANPAQQLAQPQAQLQQRQQLG